MIRILAAVVITAVIVFNTTLQLYGHRNIWGLERQGLNGLDKQLASDKSERLAVIVITEEKWYITKAVSNEFIWAMVQDGKIKRANFRPGDVKLN